MKLNILLLCLSFFINCSSNNIRRNKDSLFVEWNKSTFQSLERQISTADDSQKSVYLNRLAAFKAFIQVEKKDTFNKSSIRYEFLSTISQREKNGDIFIVEANQSGESVSLRNFVVSSNSKSNTIIEFYNYIHGKWRKSGESKIEDFQINANLAVHFNKFPEGFNHDDIIITHIKNNVVLGSEFFLYRTLANSSGIQRILDTYKMENFFK